MTLWSSPPTPVVRGRRPAVRASQSRNTRAMRVLAEGNAIPGASAKSECWIAQEVAARHACHGGRDDGLCV